MSYHLPVLRSLAPLGACFLASQGLGQTLDVENGHYYQAVKSDGLITWNDALALAGQREFNGAQGHLAAMTSQSVNDFALNLCADLKFWNGGMGPAFGGLQLPDQIDPGAGWTWVTGDAWSYTNWYPGEPNDFNDSDERGLNFEALNNPPEGAGWNDVTLDWPGMAGYIVEFSGTVCYADCDASGTLELFDFLCFVNQFNAGEPAADCDESGSIDLFDFLCFTNAFNAGC